MLERCIDTHGGRKAWDNLNGWTLEGYEQSMSFFGLERQRKLYSSLDLAETPNSLSRSPLASGFNQSSLKTFFEMPFSFEEAETVSYAGKASFAGRDFNLVYIRGGPRIHKDDEYIVWLSENTNLLSVSQFKISGPNHLSRGAVIMTDHRVVHGIVVPFKMKIIKDLDPSSLEGGFDIEKIDFNVAKAGTGA